MKSVIVTGGSGKAGRAAIRELLKHGYQVMNVDTVAPAEQLCHFMKADLNDLGQAIDALRLLAGTVDRRRTLLGEPSAVIHMAGIPAPGLAPDATIFQNNMMTTYNVFSAAVRAGIRRVVWASSETIYGLPFTRTPPAFAPVTEEHPLAPETGYALAKILCEKMASEMHRWNPGTHFVGLRISNIFEERDYESIASFWNDPALRKWNLWSWVDSRDVAQACRLGLEADVSGADHFTIAAADTLMKIPNPELMAAHFPGVPVDAKMGPFDTLLSIEKARRVLGYAPQHTWRT
ncbi:NAD-dependent epimerase/dehydratase family protein [Bradyrhizobium canariense]|uniref:Nucleoside-diphosphate-sugar epimerase n=1 Tax=Bradyrhizobium canariense TaxID=255045 RepID=A0A1H1VZE4_9BRAD|nr:NAD(P)-dependent oxidoreductase [Bradyrhizobium canariense]SDS89800.1 Nucleoside-diphosphate-sugar epimerase [Bradyrhizobium canariense]